MLYFINFFKFISLDFLIVVLPLLITIAFVTLLERKVLAGIQKRRGPNVVGFFGLLQPISDGVKLLLKEIIIPFNSNKVIFFFSPVFMFLISLLNWSVIFALGGFFNFNMDCSVFYVFCIMSLGVYGVILAGWSSNSKYGFLGAVRAIAQMVSYEVVLFFSIFPIFLLTQSINFLDIIQAQQQAIPFIFVLPISAICFFIAILAETNRTPFDLPEAEGELVSGYNIEFSAMIFALFFLAEYANIILSSVLFTMFFLGWSSSHLIFSFQASIIVVFFLLLRGVLPRYKFDQLIKIGWLVLLPICLTNLAFCFAVALF